MTKYRLKDQELQKHLDAISDGAFSECLKDDLYFFEDGVTRINFGKEFGYATRFSVLILKDELEALPEYSPNDWNNYPEVTPPEDVLMLVECIDGYGKTFKTCAEYIGDGAGAYYWRNEYEQDVPVKRFRPLE
jgi:hypothetical protein